MVDPKLQSFSKVKSKNKKTKNKKQNKKTKQNKTKKQKTKQKKERKCPTSSIFPKIERFTRVYTAPRAHKLLQYFLSFLTFCVYTHVY